MCRIMSGLPKDKWEQFRAELKQNHAYRENQRYLMMLAGVLAGCFALHVGAQHTGAHWLHLILAGADITALALFRVCSNRITAVKKGIVAKWEAAAAAKGSAPFVVTGAHAL